MNHTFPIDRQRARARDNSDRVSVRPRWVLIYRDFPRRRTIYSMNNTAAHNDTFAGEANGNRGRR